MEPFTDEGMPRDRTSDREIMWIKVLKRQIVSTHLVPYLFTTMIHEGFEASFNGTCIYNNDKVDLENKKGTISRCRKSNAGHKRYMKAISL